jgi:protein involved in polysaccharide export with SLBB domain
VPVDMLPPAFSKYSNGLVGIFCIFFLYLPLAYGNKSADFQDQNLIQGSISTSNLVTPMYKIAPGDVLSFSIQEETEYDQDHVIVRPDGYATIRPIGQVFVAGMNIQELTHQLEGNLDPYINHSQVFLNIQEFHTPRIYLLGSVSHPGVYQPDLRKVSSSYNVAPRSTSHFPNMDWTVSNLIIRSGGLNYDADLSNIQISKHNGDKQHVNLFALLIEGDLTQDIVLEEGDTIQVPQLSTIPYGDNEFKLLCEAGIYPEQFPVRVLGEVEKPGLFYVSSDTPYINTAIALASGYKRNAMKRSVIINRKSKGQEIAKLIVDPEKVDLMLRPNDIVEIRDAQSAKAIRGAETISRMAAPFWWISNFR